MSIIRTSYTHHYSSLQSVSVLCHTITPVYNLFLFYVNVSEISEEETDEAVLGYQHQTVINMY